MALTYSQLVEVKNRISKELETKENGLDAAIVQFTSIKDGLTSMQSTYAGWVSEVNDYLTANPTDDAAKVLKAQKDAIVAEFGTKKTRATSLETSVSGV